MDSGDPWEVLGIAPSSDADALRSVYRALLKKHKPETDPEGFRRIRGAYERASDLVARRGDLRPAPIASGTPATSRPEGDVEAAELDAIFARFDAAEPEAHPIRIAIARQAMQRFPALHEPRALFAEALDGMDDPEASERELVAAYWAEVPGSALVLLHRAPHRVERADLARIGASASDFDRALAALALARNGGSTAAIEIATELLSPLRSAPIDPRSRSILVEVGIELFAARDPELGSNVAAALLEEETNLAIGQRRPSARFLYLRELWALAFDAPIIGLADVALVLADPAAKRVAKRSDGSHDLLLGHALTRSPTLSAVWIRRPMPPLGPPKPAHGESSWAVPRHPAVRSTVLEDIRSTFPVERLILTLVLGAVAYVAFAIVWSTEARRRERTPSASDIAGLVARYELELSRVFRDPAVEPCTFGLHLQSDVIPRGWFEAPQRACVDGVELARALEYPPRCTDARRLASQVVLHARESSSGQRRFREYARHELARTCSAPDPNEPPP